MNKCMRIVFVYGLIISSIFTFWYVVGQPRPIPEPEVAPGHTLQCVSYAPFEKDQSPFDFAKGMTISNARIDADLAILSRSFSCIRTYSVAGLEALPEYAEKYGMKVLLGAWVTSDPKITEQELQKVVALAKQHPESVRAVVVGNEALLRREVTGQQLAGYINQVKAALPGVPVTYADVWEFWLKHPEVGEVTDFVMIHILPYWEDDPVAITAAMAHVKKIREEIGEKIPGKEIVIGETGWPSEGRMREGALPSLENQARFIRGFVALAEQEHWQYNLIEAFDQPWKRSKEGAVGGYWGLYSSDRTDKHILSGPVSNFPNWLSLFAQSVAIALASLIPLCIGRHHPEMSARRWLKFSTTATGGAILIVLQGHQFAIISTNTVEYIWAFIVLSLAAGVYLLALKAVASKTTPMHLSLDTAMDFLRGKSRLCPEAVNGTLRLGVITCALIGVLGLVLDARYRSFNNFGFAIPALAYLWFFQRQGLPNAQGMLERLSALLLTSGAVAIMINETPLNWQADIWVIICLLLAYPLWRESRGVSLRPLLPFAFLVLVAFGVFTALRNGIFISERLVEVCADTPDTAICLVRAMIGRLMYNQIFAWTSLILAALAVWRNSVWLCSLALVASLAGLCFYNVNLAAIAFVLAGLTLVHKKRTETISA
ncbi:MAG: exo-beta-1,3-glucanase [Proteobacteria bacterium]|nr:exo-beta-1,3-glucanase [Pseudomonadota bacterium]